MLTDKSTFPTDRAIIWAAAAAVVIAAGGLYYYFHYWSQPAPAVEHPTAATPPAAAPAHTEPAIEHPVPRTGAAEGTQALPPLDSSDEAVHAALTALPGAAALERFLVPQMIVRHIVATIDNLPRKKVAVELRPIQPTAGQFVTTGEADHLTLSKANYARYKPFMQVVQATDTNALAALYFHYYPLFQQSYENLGYPDRYFNDRVIEVIDNLLATPDVKGPIELMQPNVMFTYADPNLEALPAGQKTLIRMGSENMEIIKAKLRELRAILATHKK